MIDYYKLDIKIKPYIVDAADLMAAFLADIGFESFEQNDKGLCAYIPTSAYDEVAWKDVLSDFPLNVEIQWDKEMIKGQDWNKEWEKKYFHPLVLGEGRVVVHSTFHTDFPKTEMEIVIDPKMAFGTGHHATPTMMVNHLFNLDLKGKRVLEMGAGTGILSIIAKKLGAAEVTGIEIDPGAHENSIENASLNGVEVDMRLGDGALLEEIRNIDIFLANINRNIILADLERYIKTIGKGGVLILSGFYHDDVPLLEAALNKNGMKIAEVKTEGDGWASIISEKIS